MARKFTIVLLRKEVRAFIVFSKESLLASIEGRRH